MSQPKRYLESLYPHYGQSFTIDEVLYEDNSEHQELILFRNQTFGRILALDGVIQTTEADEKCYHEMLVHVPMLSHANPQNILIIGGGDGGTAREVLKHNIHKVTMVEIDSDVVDFSEKHLPKHSNGVFNHEKLKLVIADGSLFVKETKEKYDIIIIDSTDPEGPAEVLFTQEFYQDCHNILSEKGILVTQNGVPFFQPAELINTRKRQSAVFVHSHFYVTATPTYIGGFMTLSFASDFDYTEQELSHIQKNYQQSGLKDLFYYTPQIHKAAFALPAFIAQKLKETDLSDEK